MTKKTSLVNTCDTTRKDQGITSVQYKCQECERTFASARALKQHSHVHSTVKPYICKTCSKAYTQQTSLSRHIRYNPKCAIKKQIQPNIEKIKVSTTTQKEWDCDDNATHVENHRNDADDDNTNVSNVETDGTNKCFTSNLNETTSKEHNTEEMPTKNLQILPNNSLEENENVSDSSNNSNTTSINEDEIKDDKLFIEDRSNNKHNNGFFSQFQLNVKQEFPNNNQEKLPNYQQNNIIYNNITFKNNMVHNNNMINNYNDYKINEPNLLTNPSPFITNNNMAQTSPPFHSFLPSPPNNIFSNPFNIFNVNYSPTFFSLTSQDFSYCSNASNYTYSGSTSHKRKWGSDEDGDDSGVSYTGETFNESYSKQSHKRQKFTIDELLKSDF